jgi:hypothetical protein
LFLFLFAASTARSYLYGVQVGQLRILPGTTQIKSEDKAKEEEEEKAKFSNSRKRESY